MISLEIFLSFCRILLTYASLIINQSQRYSVLRGIYLTFLVLLKSLLEVFYKPNVELIVFFALQYIYHGELCTIP